jgi:hypothetical protein
VNSGYDLKKLFIGKIKIEDLEVLTPFIEKHLSSVETILILSNNEDISD